MAALPPNAQKPWFFNTQTKIHLPPGVDYKVMDAAPEDCKQVAEWYMQSPARGYTIKRVQVIHNPQMGRMFEGEIALLQNRHGNVAFAPKWEADSKSTQEKQHRKETLSLLEGRAKVFKDPSHPNVFVVPMWHGTKKELLDSIFKIGYANLATTDSGFFGKGIYGAGEAEYSHRVYAKGSQGSLLINWMATYSAYPVIDGDIPKLMGKGNYANYDSHFAPVVPANPQNINEVNYLPCKPDQKAIFTEIVVFNHFQVLPRYIVETQADLLTAPGVTPPILNDFISLLIDYQSTLSEGTDLYTLIEEKLLIYGSNNRALNEKEITVYNLIKQIQGMMEKGNSSLEKQVHILLQQLNEKEVDDVKEELTALLPTLAQAAPHSPVSLPNVLVMAPPENLTPEQKNGWIALQQNPSAAKAYCDLGVSLSSPQTITLPDNRMMTKRELFLEAIRKEPNYAKAYAYMGNELKAGEVIELPDARMLNDRKLLCEALSLDCKWPLTYYYLGLKLTFDETFKLPDERIMNKDTLFIEQDLRLIDQNPEDVTAYRHLAFCIGEGTVTLLNGMTMKKTQLLLREQIIALEKNPKEPHVYNQLASGLSGEETVKLANGQELNVHQLQREAILREIEKDPKNMEAYNRLESLLIDQEIFFLSGKKMDKKQLQIKKKQLQIDELLQKIEKDPKNLENYISLANTLEPEVTVKLTDGRTMNKKLLLIDVYLQKNKMNSMDPYNYFALGSILAPGETIKLLNGKVMSQRQLNIEYFLKKIVQYPEMDDNYSSLASMLAPGENVKFENGREMNERQLRIEFYLLKIKFFNEYVDKENPFAELSKILAPGEELKLLDGRKVDARQLQTMYLHKMINVDIPIDNPYSKGNPDHYLTLADKLLLKETVKLRDGRVVDARQLRIMYFVKKIYIDRKDPKNYSSLANLILPKETVQLDGFNMTKKDVLKEGKRYGLKTSIFGF